jgi:hypothetical protein
MFLAKSKTRRILDVVWNRMFAFGACREVTMTVVRHEFGRKKWLFHVVLLFLVFCATPFAYARDDWSVINDALPPDYGTALDESSNRDCVPDFIVTTFPYMNTADLRGAGNGCSFRSGQDHSYEIHIPQSGLYTFSLCNSTSGINSYLYLSTECCGGILLASNDNGCSTYGASEISCHRLNAGIYYLDIEPFSAGGERTYTLNIFSCPDPCPVVFTTDTTLDNGDGTYTWLQLTDENDVAPLYEGPWFDPTMPPGRDPYYGFGHYSWYNCDYGWKNTFPDYNLPEGAAIQSARIYICAWDIDQQDCSNEHPGEPQACELDHVYADGVLLNPEYLQGNNEVWSVTIFDIPPAALLDDGMLNMFIDIDVWNNHRYWATTLNYSLLEVIYRASEPLNHPPYAPAGYGWPACIEDDDSLSLTITGPLPADPDGDAVSYHYRWFVRNDFTAGGFVNDESAPPHYRDHSGPTIPAQDSDIGDEWRVEAWAMDVHSALSLQPLIVTFPDIVASCGEVENPIVGWDYGDLDSTEYPTANEQRNGPANAIRRSNLAWLGATVTDDSPTPRCIDQDIDDGVVFLDSIWPGCSEICVDITFTTGLGYTGQELFLNAWKDGDFDSSFTGILCSEAAPEYIIQDAHITGLGPNESIIRRFCFMDPSLRDGGVRIMRFRLTNNPVGAGGYVGVDSVLGETEDYIVSVTEPPLSVELLSAAAVPEENRIVLRWETASEHENDHFDIERRAGDAPWRTIGEVQGAGTSSQSHSYSFVDSYVLDGVPYFYRLISEELNGARTVIFVTESAVMTIVGQVSTYQLHANWPNPFNASTMITYDLKENGIVLLRVFDVLGREVAVLVNGNQNAGRHTAIFDGSSLSSGIYFYRLDAGDFTDTKKMVLMK